MTIASFQFLGFAALVSLLYAAATDLRWRQGLLLFANLAFLGTFAAVPAMFLPLGGFLAVSYGGLLLIMATRAGWLHFTIIVIVITMFFWMKRYSFLPAAVFLPFAYTTIGLSYIFFRNLHLLVDAHDQANEKAEQERIGPVAFLNYTLNFTSLVSGPIQLFQDYARDELQSDVPPLDWITVGNAIERIATGLFKVTVLGAVLYAMHGEALAALSTGSGPTDNIQNALQITVGYTLYLYCNFSGYTDIVIGAARFYRLRLPENFDRPFSATSFIEFWNRWHITLSAWLRRYVYNTLLVTLRRRLRTRRYAGALNVGAIFVTFFLIGLWHGQTSEFAFFGVLQGLGVAGNRVYQMAMGASLGTARYLSLTASWWYQSLARGLTFTYFTLTLLFFWGSWSDVWLLANALGPVETMAFVIVLWVGASLLLSAVQIIRSYSAGQDVLNSRYTRTVWVTMLATVAVTTQVPMATPAPDIVYKGF